MFVDISNRKILIPALVGAGICVFFIKSGFLSLFFLVPLGFLGYRFDYKVAWTAFMFASIGNLILTLGLLSSGGGIWDLLFFTVMTGIFTWITSPPPSSANLPMSIRLIGGSCLGALLVTFIFIRIISSQYFFTYLDSMMNSFIAMQRNSGADVVQSALLESITTEAVLDMILATTLRGGSLISCFLLFTICRQISFGLAHMFLRRNRKNIPNQGLNTLMVFYVSPSLIWAFSASLLLVVLTRIINLVVPEIILWNILILCVILYLAQGLGILQFFLSRPSTPPILGLLFIVLFFVLLFSPVLNLVLLCGLTVLGIAENWVPFRASKINGPPSTPEAS